ncbi:MAG: 5'-3' exonuclease H3TH domain-containing protein, partial [Candidatus Scatosoma sp.]
MEKLVLIDGNSLLNRAFYATPPFTAKDGFPTNGIYGFIKLLLKIVSDKSPQYLAVAFDLHAPTFRHKMYGEYKAGRRPMPEELAVQLPVLKEVLGLMRIKIVEKEGYEADDVIGTMSRKYPVHTYIYTGDRDAYQLVNEAVSVCFTRKGVSDILELTSENFTQETGFTPAQIIDLKALMGDKSDHIPGVSGVGEQTAKNLLLRYGSLSGVYEHVNEQSPALKSKLEAGAEQAKLSYTLAKIDVDAPVDCTLSECVLKMPFPYAVRQKFAALDFRSLSGLDIFLPPETGGAGKAD